MNHSRIKICLRIVVSLALCLKGSIPPHAVADSRTAADRSAPPNHTQGSAPAFEDPQNSELNRNIYTNHFFGFSIAYPKGWRLVSAPVSTGGDPRPAGRDENKASATEQSNQQRVYTLLLTVEGSPNLPPYEWRRVGILATKLRDPNISIPDHLKAGTDMLRQRGSRVQMLGSPESMNLAGRPFWKQRLTQEENGMKYHIEMFVTKEKGYVLQITLWAMDDPGAKDLEPVMQSLKFLGEPTPATK